MSTVKKYQKAIILMLAIVGMPLILPFLASMAEMILKAGRIVGTLIRIY